MVKTSRFNYLWSQHHGSMITMSTVYCQLYPLLLCFISTHTDTSQPAGASLLNTSPPDASLLQAPSQRKQLSDFEKGKIVFVYEQGWSYQRIADYIGWPKSTVYTFIKHYIERGTHENKKVPGCPQKISETTENIILDLIERDHSITKLALMQILELNNIYP